MNNSLVSRERMISQNEFVVIHVSVSELSIYGVIGLQFNVSIYGVTAAI